MIISTGINNNNNMITVVIYSYCTYDRNIVYYTIISTGIFNNNKITVVIYSYCTYDHNKYMIRLYQPVYNNKITVMVYSYSTYDHIISI
jgi:hypothetical protein